MRFRFAVIASLAGLTIERCAEAHPGHGISNPATVTHQLIEPVHAVFWFTVSACVLAIVAGVTIWSRRRSSSSVARVRSRRG